MCEFVKFHVKHGRFPHLDKCNGKYCSCATIVFLLGFFLWFTALTLRLTPPDPSCSIDQFHISTPYSDSNFTINNQTIYFHLKLDNKEPYNGIYYDPLNLTISYRPTKTTNKTMSAIATYNLPAFYQGFGKTATRSGLALVDGAVYNGTATAATANNTAVFEVKLDTRTRYKSAWGIRKKHHFLVAANFKVNVISGKKVSKKGIVLKWTNAAVAAAPSLCRLVVVVVLSIAVILFVI